MKSCLTRVSASRIPVFGLLLGFLLLLLPSSRAATHSLDVIPLTFERYHTGSEICMLLSLSGLPGEKYRIESIPFGTANSPWARWEPLDDQLRVSGPVLCLNLSTFFRDHRHYRAVREQVVPLGLKGSLPPATQMIWIEPGAFVMGSSKDEVERESDEGPLTVVVLTKPYALGIHEVTQTQYIAVMEENPSRHKFDPSHPVTNAHWEDAGEYCRRLTLLERSVGLLGLDLEYRLPTEAEWEYACRAGTITRFHHGDDPDYSELGAYAWYKENSEGSTHPVMTRLPNAWGLTGMHGNVHEWCSDRYGFLPGGYVEDPKGAREGEMHVIRGGSWLEQAKDCRTADRHRDWFVSDFGNVGFRIALGPVK
ncbi:formylglycine-generating enzyme family protein [Verrucomicrobia bacterium]|nr:formylglycine-generating enzyme family protein [Verrucomicrobiota bacterium]MDA7657087.1 formylglycine-generating enzyme family protein [Verrucomicrobiota bacterium]MDA7866372.1 formylglycine-generating enzyme family protein [Verrucomicrobiota bacterium]